jgi:ATP-dependent RNA helicase RhlE
VNKRVRGIISKVISNERAESATWLSKAKEYSVSFEHFSLDPRIVSGVKDAGYTTPTPIQQQAIPVALQGRDVLGLAQTGTGKTAAFVLPILQRLIHGPTQPMRVRALVLAPTRELAEQIHEMTAGLARNTRVRSATVYGGVGKAGQLAALRRGAEIIIACPGRLLDFLGERSIDLSHVEVLVLDEADRMCDMGFLPDVRRILKVLPAQRQTLFFAATMPDEIRQLADDILHDPVTVQIGVLAPIETVSHALYPVPESLKKELLLATLQQTPTGRVLIFTRTKYRARNLARDLAKHNYRVSALQGNMSQNQRQAALNGFRDGKYDILVATDVAARGIDVLEITHVINFDMPDTVDAYTHRIGRTGRAHLSGEAFSFAGQADEPMVREIEKVLGTRIERRWLPDFDYGRFAPERQFQPNRPVQPRRASTPAAPRPVPPRARREGGVTYVPRRAERRRGH